MNLGKKEDSKNESRKERGQEKYKKVRKKT